MSEQELTGVCAPQVLTSPKYKGNAADVWSLGVMLYVLIEGAFPFRLRRQRYEVQKMLGRIVNADYKAPVHVRALHSASVVYSTCAPFDVPGLHNGVHLDLPVDFEDGYGSALWPHAL